MKKFGIFRKKLNFRFIRTFIKAKGAETHNGNYTKISSIENIKEELLILYERIWDLQILS